MKRRLPTLLILLGGLSCLAACALFWYLTLTPGLDPVRPYALTTIGLFTAGLLLISLTPLGVSALSDPEQPGRGRRAPDDAGAPKGHWLSRVLIWIILAEFAAIALLG